MDNGLWTIDRFAFKKKWIFCTKSFIGIQLANGYWL